MIGGLTEGVAGGNLRGDAKILRVGAAGVTRRWVGDCLGGEGVL